jgi:hypothetical protein
VIIKGNYQWTGKVSTSTDRIKGLIWQVLNHPSGFTGEIIVCDNTQGYAIDENDNNSEDPNQSIVDVVNTFRAKGYPVYLMDWKDLNYHDGVEYSQGDYNNCYIYNTATKVSYPKFKTPSGRNYVSLRSGVWDSLSASYDSSKLCIINFPVLKHHGMAGATVAVKNWIGVMSVDWANERYGGWSAMHYTYLFTQYALVARIMSVTYPRLSIVDAAWTSAAGNTSSDYVVNTKALFASTDPVAVSWYAAKYMLTPVAYNKTETNPDFPSGKYHDCLTNWKNFFVDSAGIACTMDSTKISVYNRGSLAQMPLPSIPLLDSPANGVTNQLRVLSLYWSPSNYAMTYHLQVATDSIFSNPLLNDSSLNDVTFHLTGLQRATTYYWHVRAKNTSGSGSYSPTWKFTTGNSTTISFSKNAGWNLISLPLTVDDAYIGNLFQNAASRAFYFDPTGYKATDTLKNGIGYWLKFSSAGYDELAGWVRPSDTIYVQTGWNLVGSISTPVPTDSVTTQPSHIIVSSYYCYQSGYVIKDTLKPGMGYWVKVNQNGKLILR